MTQRRRCPSHYACAPALAVLWAGLAYGAPSQVSVDITPVHAINHFSPLAAFGAGVDSVPYPAVPRIYTPSNVNQMLQAGFGAVSYRLYTELSVQDWHWNPAGGFSETPNQGYWTSDAKPGRATIDTFGYRLPRRGFTHDQGNDDDYSRVDDGDPATFWKSNPYLTSAYTGDPDSGHPQWVLFDMGSAVSIDAARINWAAPYAVSYAVQYWTGDDPLYDPAGGDWVDFPAGSVTIGAGGTVTLPLGKAPRAYEYYRVVMTQSSGTCTRPASPDPRDCAGYAIAEMGLGTLGANGVFEDLVRHSADQKQTITYASSVDPWHAQSDRVHDQEQPGFDIVFSSGLTRGLAATVPIPMMYSTPANAAAEIAYLKAQGYAIARVEMGEEPDGQFITPEDDAALYGEFAAALHAVDPALQLGGPVFESNRHDVRAWPDAKGGTSWTRRFIAYLRAHGHLRDLNFFSFEHYPFSACGNAKTQANLISEPNLLRKIIDIWRDNGLPAGIPIFITETNYSQNETDAAQLPAGAIWYADLIGGTLSQGGAGIFYYEYEPIPLSPSYPCPGWGTYGVLLGNRKYMAQAPLSQFFAAQMLTQVWAQPVDLPHTLFSAIVTGNADLVGAYPLHRPDGDYAVLLVNRDLTHAHEVQIGFDDARAASYFDGRVEQTVFGSGQYRWRRHGRRSHPDPDGPQVVTSQPGGRLHVYTLPAASITVLKGRVASP